MKTSLWCALVLALVAFSSPVANAQGQAATGTRVAVIDISKVFKEHTLFNSKMEAMKKEVQQFQTRLQQEGQKVQQLQTQLKNYVPGSAEYKGIEEEMLQLQANAGVKAAKQKKEFMQKEAKIYFDTYQDVLKIVDTFARQHGIAIVVRFNSDDIDPTNRQSVLEGVNRAVVIQIQSDITNPVLDVLKRKYNSGVATPPAAGRVQR